jgi:hypothetical protein
VFGIIYRYYNSDHECRGLASYRSKHFNVMVMEAIQAELFHGRSLAFGRHPPQNGFKHHAHVEIEDHGTLGHSVVQSNSEGNGLPESSSRQAVCRASTDSSNARKG